MCGNRQTTVVFQLKRELDEPIAEIGFCFFFPPKLHVGIPKYHERNNRQAATPLLTGIFFFFQKLLTGMNNFSNPIWGGTGGRKE